MAGRTIDVTIITSCTILMKESSGFTDYRTLAPASARYAKRQIMWGGNVRRERFRNTKTMEIAVTTGQKILLSGRDSKRQSLSAGLQVARINGDTIEA